MRRSRLCRQYLEISFVALCSQSWSAAKRIISTAATHLGALGAGSPGGVSLPKSVRNVSDGVEYLRQVLNPKNETEQTRLNSLESPFAGIEAEQKK